MKNYFKWRQQSDFLYYVTSGPACMHGELPFTWSVYETADGRPVGRSNSTVLPYNVDLSCTETEMVKDRFKLTTDGSLYYTDEDQVIPYTRYCVDDYVEAGPPEATGQMAIMCFSNTKPLYNFIIWACFVASAVCLVLTLVVYATLSYLRNVHGSYIMCYVACLLVWVVCLLIQKLTRGDKNNPLCIPFGYFTLFAILTTSCWLNVICFDIYWMLRYNNSIKRNTSISVRTIVYHIYCWGFPSIYVSTGYLFQHSQHETLLKLSPDIGYQHCWFNNSTLYGRLIFYLLPVCVMLTTNLILFLLTAIHCSRIKSELNKFRRNDSKVESFIVYKERFVTSIKLFLVMGIPLTTEMPNLFFQNEWIIWDIVSAITRLQGVLIFIILVAKRKVIMDLWKKFRGSIDDRESTQINTIPGSS